MNELTAFIEKIAGKSKPAPKPEDQAMHDNVAAQFASQMGDAIKLASYEDQEKVLTEDEELRLVMFNSFKNEVISLI